MKKILLLPFAVCCIVSYAQPNYSLTLNGTNQYVTIGAPLSTGSSYTKEAWVYITTSAGSRNIISSSDAPFWLNAGTLSAGQAGSYTNVTDPTTFPLNRWVHVAVTYDNASTTMRLYRDGILISTNTSVGAYTSQNNFIGSHQGSGSYLQGSVDEVRIWNTVRTQAELKQYMYKGPATNASGLVAYYKCNDGTGSTLTNATGGTNGTLQNSPAWSASPVQFAGNALNLDGTNDFVQLASNINVGTNDFTFEIWVKPVSTTAYMAWANDNNLDANNQFRLAILNTTAEFTLSGSGGSPFLRLTTPSGTVPTGSWTHIAVVRNGTTGYVYINGVQQATGSTTLIDNQAGGEANKRFRIGSRGNSSDANGEDVFNGELDDFRYWNIARSQAQIQASYDTELDPDAETNLVTYYTFNMGIAAGTNTGLTVTADMKSTNNGTLNNFALSGVTSNLVAQNNLLTLPLQWQSFTVKKQGSKALLNWSTAGEKNTKDFVIQHSYNGTSWKAIDAVTAAGNSNGITHYNYIHADPVKGVNFYRIRQNDLDGKSSYSNTRSLKFSKDGFAILINPVTSGMLHVQVIAATPLSLYNTEGQLLWKKQLNAGTEIIDMSRYSKGTYLLKSNEQTEKIVLQ